MLSIRIVFHSKYRKEKRKLTVPVQAHGRTSWPVSDWQIRHALFSVLDESETVFGELQT